MPVTKQKGFKRECRGGEIINKWQGRERTKTRDYRRVLKETWSRWVQSLWETGGDCSQTGALHSHHPLPGHCLAETDISACLGWLLGPLITTWNLGSWREWMLSGWLREGWSQAVCPLRPAARAPRVSSEQGTYGCKYITVLACHIDFLIMF